MLQILRIILGSSEFAPYACIDYFNQYLVFNWTMILWQRNTYFRSLITSLNSILVLLEKNKKHGAIGLQKMGCFEIRIIFWLWNHEFLSSSPPGSSSQSSISWFGPHNSYKSKVRRFKRPKLKMTVILNSYVSKER